MSFHYKNHQLFCEELTLESLATAHGTPLYVYSATEIIKNYQDFVKALAAVPHHLCYAVKANANLSILALLAEQGSFFDVVSIGELQKVEAAGGKAAHCIFSGVGKGVAEIAYALEQGIMTLNIESAEEWQSIEKVAKAHGVKAPVAIRVNPDIDAKTHPYISTGLKKNKFGIGMHEAEKLYQRLADSAQADLQGIAGHIGSQMLDPAPYQAAARHLLQLAQRLQGKGITLKHLDIGGGFGIRYQHEQPPAASAWFAPLLADLTASGLTILIEPGRAIVGNAGVLLTQVRYRKENQGKHFAIVDAAMTELLRPSLYQAYHDIVPLKAALAESYPPLDIVGPVCESGDFLGKNRQIPAEAGDFLAILSAGAYGSVMASQYNARPLAAEVLVYKNQAAVVRRRQALADLWQYDTLAKPWTPAVKTLRFRKMQALGNDFIVIDNRQPHDFKPEDWQKLADRHFGIGADQILLVENSQVADFRYRIINADGSEVGQCGNGARCFMEFLRLEDISQADCVSVETLSGTLLLQRDAKGNIRVDMGVPRFAPQAIPLAVDEERAVYTLTLDGQALDFYALSLGNPHAIFKVADVDLAPVKSLGARLEVHPLFPQRANIGFMQIIDQNTLKLRVFERGAGETLACGSGAAAAAIIARRFLGAASTMHVLLPGGTLEIFWDGGHVWLSGPAQSVFSGEITL
jgi:diaminopimelate decarboxylase